MIVEAETSIERETLLDYLSTKLDVDKEILLGFMPYRAFAVVRDGIGRGAILLTNYRRTSIEVIWAGEPGWVSRRDLRHVLDTIFSAVNVNRAYGIVKAANTESRTLARKIGCHELAVLQDEFGPGDDGVLCSMTRGQCRWVKC